MSLASSDNLIDGPVAVKGTISCEVDESLLIEFQEGILPETIESENYFSVLSVLPAINIKPESFDKTNTLYEDIEDGGTYLLDSSFNIPSGAILSNVTIYCIENITVSENVELSSVTLISEKDIEFSSGVINNSKYIYCDGCFSSGSSNEFYNTEINAENVIIGEDNIIDNCVIIAENNINVGTQSEITLSSILSKNRINFNSYVYIETSVLMSLAEIYFYQNCEVSGVIYTDGKIVFKQYAIFTGSIAAEEGYVDKNADITFDSDVVEDSIPTGLSYTTGTIINLEKWEESY